MTDDEFDDLIEDDYDDLEDGDELEETAEEAGEAVGAGIMRGILGLLKAFGLFCWSIFSGLTYPLYGIKNKLYKGLALGFLKKYHKTAGGDRLGLEQTPGGKLELTPVKYRSVDEVEMDEQPGWKAKGRDKVWKPSTVGQDGPRLGKVPVVALDSESWKATTTLESRVAEAVDMGETRPLYDVSSADLKAELAASTGGAAVADGGTQVQNLTFEPRDSPIFEDVIVNLGSDEYDGQAVSWTKATDLMYEQTTTEEMANQETRGKLAGQAGRDMQSLVVKLMLIAAGIAALGLVGDQLVNFFFGGSGGGGESGGGGTPIGSVALTNTLGNLLGI